MYRQHTLFFHVHVFDLLLVQNFDSNFMPSSDMLCHLDLDAKPHLNVATHVLLRLTPALSLSHLAKRANAEGFAKSIIGQKELCTLIDPLCGVTQRVLPMS